MPEGHTLHRLARDLNQDLRSKELSVTSPQGRFSDAASLDGSKLECALRSASTCSWSSSPPAFTSTLGLLGKLTRKKLALSPRPSQRLSRIIRR
jgi:hypothetical protein